MVQPPGLALRQGVGFKGQAAGACTGAPVAAAPAQKGGHIALAAHAHAQRTVDEALGLDAAVLCDVLHLGQAQFPRQHHPGKAQFFQFQCALQAVHAHLGGSVARQLRRDPADQGRHRQILTDDSIGPAGSNGTNGGFQRGQLSAVHRGVQGHMHRNTPGMAEAHRFFQRIFVKIAGAGAGIKACKAQIYRVRAAEHRCTKHFLIAHRGKDLDLRHSSPSSGLQPRSSSFRPSC